MNRNSLCRRTLLAFALARCCPAAAVEQTPLVRVPDGRLLAPDIARIVKNGELVVALLNIDTRPFVYVKDGELRGVDIDLVRKVAEGLRVPIRFDRSAITHDEVVQRVANGQADLGVSKLARTLKRAQLVMFSNPYMHLEHALLINRVAFARMAGEQSVSQAVRNFTGTIAVLTGSSWGEFAHRHFVRATPVRFATWPEVIEAVKSGAVVAAYRDAVEVRTVMRADPELALTLRTVTFTDLNSVLCVMVGSQDAVLQSFVNEVVANQHHKLTASELIKAMNS